MAETSNDPLLVIGATGQIGEYLLARTSGRPVTAMARRADRIMAHGHVRAVAFAAARTLSVGAPAAKQAISTIPVWHLPEILDSFADAGLERLVCFSTSSVVGKSDSRTARERLVVERVAAAETAVQARCGDLGVTLTILRPTLIYGSGRDQTIAAAARFIRRFGLYPVYGAATGARQPVHADDLARAALAALDTPATHGRTYSLGGGETLAYRDMIARIFDTLGRRPRLVRVPLLPQMLGVAGLVIPGSELSADVARRMNIDLAFDMGEAAADFGYAPRGFLAGGLADLFGPGAAT